MQDMKKSLNQKLLAWIRLKFFLFLHSLIEWVFFIKIIKMVLKIDNPLSLHIEKLLSKEVDTAAAESQPNKKVGIEWHWNVKIWKETE